MTRAEELINAKLAETSEAKDTDSDFVGRVISDLTHPKAGSYFVHLEVLAKSATNPKVKQLASSALKDLKLHLQKFKAI